MSLRFRIKVGPFVYDEKLGGPIDRRPSLLTPGDLCVLASALLMLAFIAGMVIFG